MLIDSFDTLLFFVVFAVAAAAASFFSSFFDLNTELFSSGFISLLYLILFITNIFCCISNLFLTFCLKCFRPQLYCQLLRYIVLKIFFFLTTVASPGLFSITVFAGLSKILKKKTEFIWKTLIIITIIFGSKKKKKYRKKLF